MKKKFIICVALASLPNIVVVVFILRGVHNRNEYKQFLLNFDGYISFAIKMDALRAEFYGASTRLTAENANAFYMMIFDGGYYYYDE